MTNEGELYMLQEKDTKTKLNKIIERSWYTVAAKVARSKNFDQRAINDIFRRHGDDLERKGDFDGAIQQYIRTIGTLEPSYVIRKFLHADRIHNLTNYLQALHSEGLATVDHTTLLLNCYTRQEDIENLNKFIGIDSEEIKFEVSTAIAVCRQSRYYDHALFLAKKHQKHSWYLKILLEDLNDALNALHYIGTLEFSDAETNLQKFGKTLVSSLPKETTRFLMTLCTNYKPGRAGGGYSSIQFSQLQEQEEANTKKKNQIAARNDDGTATTSTASSSMKSINIGSGLDRTRAKPGEFIHIYVKHPEWLTIFLEFIITQGEASSLIYNTLLELYLREDDDDMSARSNAAEKEEQEENDIRSTLSRETQKERWDKAERLLKDPRAKFDEDHALLLAKTHNFSPGLLYLYEKLGLYYEIVQYHMEHNEYPHVVQACKKFWRQEPDLWVQALSYFAEQQDDDCHTEIVEILEQIERDNLLPPLLVVKILSKSATSTLSVIKDYIARVLTRDERAITEAKEEIDTHLAETQQITEELFNLKTRAVEFQGLKCAACPNTLDLPSINFLCMHSFHQDCLPDNETECPICTSENRRIREIQRSMEGGIHAHDTFFKQFQEASDGFDVAAQYFGRGLFANLNGSKDAKKGKRYK
eukprot:TRINITY_DN3886_c0_g1_i1.p1 TRINITY_DN3886_c0_g1~~TRINITY_DN3886_c0_g1_i1.p1  ORF type:complete len:756 (+),score=131.66 TRINITY_DN3886_c0_g1_i1:334-2268(+)